MFSNFVFTCQVLFELFCVFFDFDREENEQLDFEALSQFDNPDYHVESIRAMKLYNRIKEVLAAVECPKKFTLADLLAPDAQRTELFIGSILNYSLHR